VNYFLIGFLCTAAGIVAGFVGTVYLVYERGERLTLLRPDDHSDRVGDWFEELRRPEADEPMPEVLNYSDDAEPVNLSKPENGALISSQTAGAYWKDRFERMQRMYRDRWTEGLPQNEWHTKHCAAKQAADEERNRAERAEQERDEAQAELGWTARQLGIAQDARDRWKAEAEKAQADAEPFNLRKPPEHREDETGIAAWDAWSKQEGVHRTHPLARRSFIAGHQMGRLL